MSNNINNDKVNATCVDVSGVKTVLIDESDSHSGSQKWPKPRISRRMRQQGWSRFLLLDSLMHLRTLSALFPLLVDVREGCTLLRWELARRSVPSQRISR